MKYDGVNSPLSEQLGYWLGMTVLFGKFYDRFKASFNEGI